MTICSNPYRACLTQRRGNAPYIFQSFQYCVDFFATRAAIGEAFAERTMALCRELSPAPRTAFSIKQIGWQSVVLRVRGKDTAQARPGQPPLMITV